MVHRRRYRSPGAQRPALERDGPVFFSELGRLTREIIPRSDARGIVIRGAGRHFSAGANIEDLIIMLEESEVGRESRDGGISILEEHLESFRFFARSKASSAPRR